MVVRQSRHRGLAIRQRRKVGFVKKLRRQYAGDGVLAAALFPSAMTIDSNWMQSTSKSAAQQRKAKHQSSIVFFVSLIEKLAAKENKS